MSSPDISGEAPEKYLGRPIAIFRSDLCQIFGCFENFKFGAVLWSVHWRSHDFDDVITILRCRQVGPLGGAVEGAVA